MKSLTVLLRPQCQIYVSPTSIRTSASKAAGPNFEILRIMARGMSTASRMAVRAFVDNGVEPLETARTNDKRFSAVKTIPTQTKPICEMAVDVRIKDLNFRSPIASPGSPCPPPYRFLHCSSKWKHAQDRSETVAKVTEENNIPPLLKAFGKNIIPVLMKALSKAKND